MVVAPQESLDSDPTHEQACRAGSRLYGFRHVFLMIARRTAAPRGPFLMRATIPSRCACLAARTVCIAILFWGAPALGWAQGTAVSGTVVDAMSLRPLADVFITLVGTELRTKTDTRGEFTIQAVAGATVTLLIQRIGYRARRRMVHVGDRALTIRLTAVAVPLEEVLVTGTAGGAAARAIGNTIETLNADEVLERAPGAEVQQVLDRVPGLITLSTQGNVGTGAKTRVRGVSSLVIPNEPLIYVDGVRVDNNPRAGPSIRNRRQIARINDLNPEDIERIEVIKGPAAATLYGTEASHGVIQILTRQGKEGPLRLGLTVKQGANWFMDPAGRLPWLYAIDPLTGQLDSVHLYLQEERAGRPIFQTGPVRSYGVSANGGTPTIRYHLSGSLDRNEGIVWYNWRHRVAARANVTLLPSDRIDLRASLGLVHNHVRLAQASSGNNHDLMANLVRGSPLDTNTRGFDMVTPEEAATVDSRSETARFIGGVRLRHRPWPWFRQRLTLGTDVGDETSSQLYPRDARGSDGPFQQLSLGQLTLDRWRVIYTTIDYLAAASFNLQPSLSAVTSLGTQYYAKRIQTVQAVGTDFPLGVSEIGGAAVTSSSSELTVNKTAGLYVQEQFGWKNRVFVTGAVRVDDNSAFGAEFDFATYPKLSATWVVSDEPFWPLPFVNTLKLRAAWGRAGQQPDMFAALRSYRPITGPGDVSALTPENLGNDLLKPERGDELELGFDAGLWQDRIGLRFTLFSQRTYDAIAPRVVAPSSGFSGSQFVNLGLTRNRGAELAVGARVVETPQFAWDLHVAFSTSNNWIQSLGTLPPMSLNGAFATTAYAGQYHQQGFPLGAYFLVKVVSAELDATGALVNLLCAAGNDLGRESGGVVPCEYAPRLYAGQPTPTWSGTVRTGVTLFQNLRLTAQVDFRGGHAIWYQDGAYGHRNRTNTRAINDSSDTILLAYDSLSADASTHANVRMSLIKGGFAKLREVSATYSLSPAWAARYGFSRAAITVAARNLATLWRAQSETFGVPVVDPEVGYPEDLSGRASTALPQFAQIVMALRLTF